MARRRKKGRRRRPSRSRTPAQRSQPPQTSPANSGRPERSVVTEIGDRAPAPPSLFSDPDPPAQDGQSLVGDGRIHPDLANQVHLAPSAVGAERVTEAVEERLRVLAALDGANRKLRRAVAAYRSEGATLKELADLMGVSAQAVHKHWLPASSRPGTDT